jgi:hypothetical protein
MINVIRSAAILSGLALLLLLQPSPSEARSCQQRYFECSSRCMGNDSPSGCITRTCIPQERNCSANETTGPGGAKGKPKPGWSKPEQRRQTQTSCIEHHATGLPNCPTENLEIFSGELRDKSL